MMLDLEQEFRGLGPQANFVAGILGLLGDENGFGKFLKLSERHFAADDVIGSHFCNIQAILFYTASDEGDDPFAWLYGYFKTGVFEEMRLVETATDEFFFKLVSKIIQDSYTVINKLLALEDKESPVDVETEFELAWRVTLIDGFSYADEIGAVTKRLFEEVYLPLSIAVRMVTKKSHAKEIYIDLHEALFDVCMKHEKSRDMIKDIDVSRDEHSMELFIGLLMMYKLSCGFGHIPLEDMEHIVKVIEKGKDFTLSIPADFSLNELMGFELSEDDEKQVQFGKN